MTRRPRLSNFCPPVEPLEGRRLYAGINGDNGDLIQYGAALSKYTGATGAGQVIAEIDSGIDYSQPALGGHLGPGFKVIGGYDFVDNDADPMDTLDHGTEVAGVLAADPYTVNGVTYQGIAPQAKLVALRVDDGDESTTVSDAIIERALQWVVDHRKEYGITIVNLSYGQGDYSGPTISKVYGATLQELHDDGITVVASAGNNGENTGANADGGINLPAADPNVIGVGSVESDDHISDFSYRGPQISLLAPGDDVESVLAGVDGGGYGAFAGTSFSAPFVAGTIALMRSVDGSLTPDDTKSILRASGVRNLDGDAEADSGVTTTNLIYPRLNVLNALNLTASRKAGTAAQIAGIGHLGNNADIAVDAQGVTHYVYFNTEQQTMLYATRSSTGQWSATQTIDTSLPNQGVYLSLALSPEGAPSVAYFDGTNGDLKYASYDGTSWHVADLDAPGSAGAYPSIVFDGNGLPAISYYRRTGGDLRIARQAFDGTWTLKNVATTDDVGRSSALAVDSKGTLSIAYEDTTHGWLDYASLASGGTSWSVSTIDKTTHYLSYIDNAFDPSSRTPWVSYYDAYPANLKVAHRSSKGSWSSETVASRGATGLFSNLVFTGEDDPHVLYWDKRQNALLLATNDDDEGWTLSVLKRNGGRFVAAVLDDTDGVIRYSYYINQKHSDSVSTKSV